ncbi:MAG: YgjV family protein [Lachnospiraceae bacterium]|nr:YgjV family protein [Lachnospiraceae bacterium]
MGMSVEIIGYIGSLLVLVSMLMTSVVRLRVINLIGSVIFAGYALLIRSYPTAFMNICLAGINLYYLIRIFKEPKIYEPVRVDPDDSYLTYLLNRDLDDIRLWFPEFSVGDERADVAYIICCKTDPACLFLGRNEGDRLEVILDYATPVYRDTSVGRFLYRHLATRGFTSFIFRQKSVGHIPYMEKIGYKKREDGAYILDI